MKSTERASCTAIPAAAYDEQFQELRGVFCARLRSDRRRLAVLSAELARAETNATPVYTDIRAMAHHLGGAAAVFEIPDVAELAYSLEQAARAAAIVHADNADPAVWSALESLVDLLNAMNGEMANGERYAQSAA